MIEKLIQKVAPAFALKRAEASLRLEAALIAKRGLEAASSGRGWGARIKSPNQDQRCVNITRARARDLVQNKPIAAKSVEVLVNSLVGSGIVARPKIKDAASSKQYQGLVNAAFAKWTKNCDADGVLDWYGLQALRVRSMVVDGEIFTKYNTRDFQPGQVPIELQVLEADMLEDGRATKGLINGIVFEGTKRQAYRFYKEHPDNPSRTAETVDVPASQVSHLYKTLRAGQVRGTSWLAPVALRIKDLDDALDANLMLQKIAACFSVFVEQPQPQENDILGNAEHSEDGSRYENVSPGTVHYLREGETVKFGQPPSTAGFTEYVNLHQHEIAAGLYVPFANATGDVSRGNFSSQRIARLDLMRMCEQVQWAYIVPMMLEQDCKQWENAAKLSGAIPSNLKIEWEFSPPPLEHLDPQAAIQADILAVRSGRMTMQEFMSRGGYPYEQQLQNIAQANEDLDKLGIKLSSDPRQPYNSDAFLSTGTAQGTP